MKGKLDLGIIIGFVLGLGGVALGHLMESKGDVLNAFLPLMQPTAAMIVIGGTFGATFVAFTLDQLKQLPGAAIGLFFTEKHDPVLVINQLAELSEKARKDGLLSLEQDAQSNHNPLIRKGLGLVVDGIETEVIKDILMREVELGESMHEVAEKILEQMGGFAPTMGVLGTVMGMVGILGEMGGDTNELAKKIAVAFVATLYGVGTANLIYLPMAGRIKAKSGTDAMINELIIEGLLSIQAGENPKIIKEKLNLALVEKIYGGNGKAATTGAEAEG